jgi:hypothetical protein
MHVHRNHQRQSSSLESGHRETATKGKKNDRDNGDISDPSERRGAGKSDKKENKRTDRGDEGRGRTIGAMVVDWMKDILKPRNPPPVTSIVGGDGDGSVLTPPPVTPPAPIVGKGENQINPRPQGEPWNPNRPYFAGETVVEDGVT